MLAGIRSFLLSKPKRTLRFGYWKRRAAAFLQLLPLCQRRAIFPGRRQPSIVATDELNFRVRNGNGWTLIVIGTDFGDPCGNRTHVWGVRGPRLNRLTNGPRPCGSCRLRIRGCRKGRENSHVLDPSSFSNRSSRFDLRREGFSRKNGTPSGTRTLDTLIKSQVLYQLS